MTFGSKLGELWQYRELFFFMVWRDVKVRYKQSLLGASWAILQPFMAMLVFTLFFGKLAKMPSDGIPYPLFTYAALVPWTFFSSALSTSGNSLVSNAPLITKIYFPRVILPAAAVLAALVDFAIASVVLVAMIVYYDIGFSWKLVMWPLLVLPLAVLACGAGMILSALNVRFRDIKYVLPFGIQLWMFLTPVIYPVSLVPEKYRNLMALNPATGVIDALRSCLIPTQATNWTLFGASMAGISLIALAGVIYFTRTEREFADII